MQLSLNISKLLQNGLKKLKRFYQVTYNQNLLATNIFIGGACCFTGDLVVQKLIEKNEKINFRRLAVMTSYGILYGYVGHVWYLHMARSKYFSSPNRQALLYLTCFCPLEDTIFYIFTGYLEGENTQEVVKDVEEKLLPTLLADACVYYPMMYCNIRFVPVHFRLTVDNTFNLFYATFLSYLKHHDLNAPMLKLNLKGLKSTDEKSI